MALLFTNMAALYSMWKAVERQEGLWMTEGLGNVGVILLVTSVRVLFVAGVGVGKGRVRRELEQVWWKTERDVIAFASRRLCVVPGLPGH